MVDAKVMRIFFILYGGSMRLFIFRKRFCGCKNLILSELILLSDRNSSCFHGSTIIIRRRSKVDTFKFEDGSWISNLDEMKSRVIEELFVDDHAYQELVVKGMYPTLDATSLEALGANISSQEFQSICIGAFKALGPNGFQVVYYQNQWDAIEEAKLVQNVFRVCRSKLHDDESS